MFKRFVILLPAIAASLMMAQDVPASPATGQPGYDFHVRVNAYNPYAAEVAHRIRDQVGGPWATRAAVAAAIIRFVQTRIAYVAEENDRTIPWGYRGVYDWWQFPDAPLRKMAGDCEDMSMLAYYMLRAVGIRAVLVSMPGHIALGVAMQGSGTYFNYNGVPYFFVECTGPVPVGEGCPNYPGFMLYQP